MTIKARYDLYLNTLSTGLVHTADCIVEEENGMVNRVGFRYRLDYLNHPNAFAIDPVHLPLNSGEFVLQCSGGIPGFLDDYLPDDWGRKVLSRLAFYRDKKRFNSNSVIDTLAIMGNSRIGALSIVPKGSPPAYDKGAPFEALQQAELAAQQVDTLNFSEGNLDEMSVLYLANSGTGVGGARPKALIYKQQRCYLAKFNRTHHDDFNHARVELACLKMAQAAGIRTHSGFIQSAVNNREVLLIERFDINQNDHRYHLITINALLKAAHSQRDIGPIFRYNDVCTLLQRFSPRIETDLQQLLTLMLFNRAIHNTDDHERNFSMIHDGEGYCLSPAYDLVPSVVSGHYHVAGFNYRHSPPKPSDIKSFGKIFGLSKPVVADCAERVMTAVDLWPAFAEQSKVCDQEMIEIKKHFCR